MESKNKSKQSSGMGSRTTTNSIDQHVLSANEKILNEISKIYTDQDKGLNRFAQQLGIELKIPRRKINVLLLGNHSAGKSSFINWYIGESILKTAVAVETQGFSIIVSGKKRETLKGKATLQLFPYLKHLETMEGVMEYLTTEVSTSRSRKFNLVNFIDTPGLVDGNMHYPFDVNNTLKWLGSIADLVFVFFDPMGQALCKRTLNIIESLWVDYSDKIHMFLAKADEAGNETDRQKVLMQIVQELCKRPGLNRTGFDMPTIYIPDERCRGTKCANQIEDACSTIEKMIEQVIQNSLNNMRRDCDRLYKEIKTKLDADTEARKKNFNKMVKGFGIAFLGIILPILLFLSVIVANSTINGMRTHIGYGADVLQTVMNPLVQAWKLVPPAYHLQVIASVVVLSGSLLILSRFSSYEAVLSKRDLSTLKSALQATNHALDRKEAMYSDYLGQAINPEDLT